MNRLFHPALLLSVIFTSFSASPLLASSLSISSRPQSTSPLARAESLLLSQAQAACSYYQPKRAVKISEVSDITPNDPAYDALQVLIENYGVIRLYCDSTFLSNQEITRFEAIDILGGALQKLYELAEATFPPQGSCRLRRPVARYSIARGISRGQFYYDSYKVLSEASGSLVYAPDQSNQDIDGNALLTRADLAVMMNRYFIYPLFVYLDSNNNPRVPDFQVGYGSLVEGDIATDVDPSAWYYQDIVSLEQKHSIWLGFPDGTYKPNEQLTRGEFVTLLAGMLDRVSTQFVQAYESQLSECVAANQANPSSPASTFSFTNGLEYSNCLEDIIALNQTPELLATRRRSNCLEGLFVERQSSGISDDEARQLIEAANQYATSELTFKLYPPAGQRARISQLYGIQYAIDAPPGQ
jgi:hypothetical protein